MIEYNLISAELVGTVSLVHMRQYRPHRRDEPGGMYPIGLIPLERPEVSPHTPSIAGPLAGLRVLELGSFIAGPFAGQLLADYGADVVKIEPVGSGDPMRRWGIT